MRKSKENSQHHPLIRTIYLYLFALVGLALLVVGGVRFVDMGLKIFVFTQADEETRGSSLQPPMPYRLEQVGEYQTEGQALSENERQAIKQWLADYEAWKEWRSRIDPVTSRRHREAAGNLAALLIGLPLYLYHWGVIKSETARRKKKE